MSKPKDDIVVYKTDKFQISLRLTLILVILADKIFDVWVINTYTKHDNPSDGLVILFIIIFGLDYIGLLFFSKNKKKK